LEGSKDPLYHTPRIFRSEIIILKASNYIIASSKERTLEVDESNGGNKEETKEHLLAGVGITQTDLLVDRLQV
jgi:hypothetical protein